MIKEVEEKIAVDAWLDAIRTGIESFPYSFGLLRLALVEYQNLTK